MGHQEVFAHVGDQIRIQAPNGKWVAPIVTGTFGSDDFFHSLLGGKCHLYMVRRPGANRQQRLAIISYVGPIGLILVTDSAMFLFTERSAYTFPLVPASTLITPQASVTDLNKQLEKARSKQQSTRGPGGAPVPPIDTVRDLLSTFPGGNEMSRDLENVSRASDPSQGGKDPATMNPKELHDNLWQVLVVRDSIVKKISKTIDKIPGLGPLVERITESISVFVFTTIEPFLKPILQSATSGLQAASAEVVDKHDQYEVFNDPRAVRSIPPPQVPLLTSSP